VGRATSCRRITDTADPEIAPLSPRSGIGQSTGREVSSTEVVLETKDAAPYDGLKKLEKALRCTVIQWFSKDLFILEFDRPVASLDDLNRILKHLRALPFVERAEPNPIVQIDLD
jgi:hypothetical protein